MSTCESRFKRGYSQVTGVMKPKLKIAGNVELLALTLLYLVLDQCETH